ncbi:Tectonic-2 [Mactra antiquata]
MLKNIILICFLSTTFSIVSSQNNSNTNNDPNNKLETVVKNAAFEEVAPCPCDLTRGACDIGCCCDEGCSADQKDTFSGCIPFLEGGQDAKTQEYKCSSNHHNKADWFPFLCVVFEYNAFLGYFYDWQYKLANNTQQFFAKLLPRSFYWYREEEARGLSESTTTYKYGVSVKTYQPDSGRSGLLTIPQKILNGQCLSTAPVQYLKNLDHTCTYTVQDFCNAASVLSSFFYIQASGLNNAFNVLAEYSNTVIAPTNVVYKCADQTYLQSYLKSTNVYSDIVSDNVVYKFNYQLPTNTCMDACGNDLCIDLNNLTDADVPATNTLPNCASQSPSQPTAAADVCSNAVIDVDYTITWNGSKIAQLDAVIVLADISLLNAAGSPNILTQRYKTTFTHINTEVGEGSTDNFLNITDTFYERSGRVGYNIGKPIFTGSEVLNSSVSPPEFMYVNTNTTRQMAVFDTTADGLCMNAGRRIINFGEDISTQCKLMLNITEFSDCSSLRKLILNRLNATMPSDLIGRRGYNDPFNRGYWVKVLRDDLSQYCLESEYFPVGLSPIDNRTGICYNMTNGISLEIFYGETGQSDKLPIYEILGSKVSFSHTEWKVSCSGPAGSVCSGSATQPFYLSSSVRFTQIPPQIPEPVSRYYEVPREEDKELCPGDRCWDNLFYPFTHRFKSESREYVFGMVSLSILFFVGYLLVSRPFW